MKNNPILFVRHAQSLANIRNDQIGYTCETDMLTDFWIQQAEKLWKNFSQILQSYNLQEALLHVHVSNTRRAIMTRDAFLRTFSWSVHSIHHPDIRLQEIIPWNPHPKYLTNEIKRTIVEILFQGDPNNFFEGWESRKNVHARMSSYIENISHSVVNIIFSHGIAISSYIQGEKNEWQEIIRLKNTDVLVYDPITKNYHIINA